MVIIRGHFYIDKGPHKIECFLLLVPNSAFYQQFEDIFGTWGHFGWSFKGQFEG